MNIAIIGAGNVGWHLARVFIKAGHPVKQIWNRSHHKAVELALEIGANSLEDLKQLSPKVDLVVLAVADDIIPVIASQLELGDHQILVHTSGSTDIEILRNHARHIGVFYPLQTFSKYSEVDFSEIPLCIEASDQSTEDQLMILARLISSKARLLSSAQRVRLHIAAVFACNFTNHFYTIAHNLLFSAGMSFEMIRPLISLTAQKVMFGAPYDLQTGPARRNDRATLGKHLSALENQPELQEVYLLISQHIVKMYDDKLPTHK